MKGSTTSLPFGKGTSPQAKQSASIPLPRSHVHRTYSELELAHEEKAAELREGQMYVRILTGIVRRGKEVGYHPNTKSALERIMRSKAQECSYQGESNTQLFDNMEDKESTLEYFERSKIQAQGCSNVRINSVPLFETDGDDDNEWILSDDSIEPSDSFYSNKSITMYQDNQRHSKTNQIHEVRHLMDDFEHEDSLSSCSCSTLQTKHYEMNEHQYESDGGIFEFDL